MRLDDTDRDALRVYAEAFAQMTGADRFAQAVKMAEDAKAIAIAGIRSRHPEFTEADVAHEWLRLLHGDELARELRRLGSGLRTCSPPCSRLPTS